MIALSNEVLDAKQNKLTQWRVLSNYYVQSNEIMLLAPLHNVTAFRTKLERKCKHGLRSAMEMNETSFATWVQVIQTYLVCTLEITI